MTSLDLTPLERRPSPLSRLRSLGASPIQVVGATIGGVILFGPMIGILVAVFRPGTDWGFVGTMTLFAACGAWALFDVLRKAGTGTGLEGVARANGLTLQRSVEARHYTGSRFRSGERIILHSLRTHTSPALEVGDTWPTKRVRIRLGSSGTVSAASAPQAEGFVRVVLPPGDHPTLRTFPMTAQLDDALWRLLGDCSLEIHGREITSSLVDLYIANNDLRMNRIMKRLTVVSTIFIPLTFLAGIWGMNFKFMPELDWRYGYATAWVVMILTAIGTWLYMKWKDWY